MVDFDSRQPNDGPDQGADRITPLLAFPTMDLIDATRHERHSLTDGPRLGFTSDFEVGDLVTLAWPKELRIL